MASIQTGIQLADRFSSPLMHVINSVNMAVSQMAELNSTMNADVNPEAFEGIRSELAQASIEAANLNQELANISAPSAEASSSAGQIGDEIQQNVESQQQFNQVVQDGGSKLEGMVNGIKRAAMAYLSINAITGFTKDAVDAANVQIEAETKLETIMRQRMNATDKEIQSMKDLASEQQNLGVIGDEVQMAGQQQLATFLTNADALSTLVPAMNNLAAQQNGVNASSSDMVGIGNMMGKAMQGQVGALTRVGITFDEAQEKVMKYGTEQERAATLAQIIQDNVGNMNEVLAKTPQGQMQNVANALGDIKENVGFALMPAVSSLFSIISANMPTINSIMVGIGTGLGYIIDILGVVIGVAGSVADFFTSNWSSISPVIYGIVGALVAYKAIMLASKVITGIATVAKGLWSVATGTATAAQTGLNGAMAACPLNWMILLIAVLIGILIAVARRISKMGGTATTTFGVITGGVNVVIQFFKNLGLEVANIALGIGNAIAALGSNIMTAFHNAICSVQSWWYDLLSTVLEVVSGICESLNNLPFVEFDYSGIVNAADDYAAKSAEAANSKEEYKSIGDAFNEGMTSFDAFQSGWLEDAYDSGAKWGDNVSKKISSKFGKKGDSIEDYKEQLAAAQKGAAGLDVEPQSAGDAAARDTAANTRTIADNTAKTADVLSTSTDDLKYLREMADREYVNRFTTASISVKMTNNNTVNNDMDLDGMVDHLRTKLEEQMLSAAEGVH